MKKTLILFLIFISSASYSQYFGEKITYLVKNQFYGQHFKTGVYDLVLVSHDSQKTIYNFDINDAYVEIHNDSIFCNIYNEKSLMFHTQLDVGDSIVQQGNWQQLKLKVDSVKVMNQKKHYFYRRIIQEVSREYTNNLIWIEGVGELQLGVDFFNQLLDGISHIEDSFLAYCIDGQPYRMNGEVWEADEDCSFENSKIGISKLKDAQRKFTISPNPSNGIFQIMNASEPIVVERITIYDLQGKRIFEENISQHFTEKVIDFTAFPPSMYQVIIQRKDGNIETHKIIKQ
jgi:hypothetical protein